MNTGHNDPDNIITDNSSSDVCSVNDICVLSHEAISCNQNQNCSDTILTRINSNPQANTFFFKKGLQIFHLNIHYLHPKIDDIKILVSQNPDINIMCLSETFLDNRVMDSELTMDGFDFFRKDRSTHGGGLIIYFDINLSVLRREDLEENDIESIWFEIKHPNSKPVLFFVIHTGPRLLSRNGFLSL